MALGHGGHAPPFDAIGAGGDFDAVADAAYGLVAVKKVAGNTNQVRVVADVFGGAPSRKKDPHVLFGHDVAEGDVRLDGIALKFAGDVPTLGRDLVQDHVVAAGFRPGDHGRESLFLDAQVGIERIDGFGGIADDDEDFGGHCILPWTM